MAYKFQIGAAQLSGALTQEGTATIQDQLIVTANGAEITGAVSVVGAVSASSNLSAGGALDIEGAADVKGAVSLAAAGTATTVRGTLAVTEATTLNGNVALGDGNLDVIEFKGDISSSAQPRNNNAFDWGASGRRWANVYAVNIDAQAIDSSGPISGSELTGVLQYELDVHTTGGLAIDAGPFDNSANVDLSLKNVDNFANERILKWDGGNYNFEDSNIEDDGSEVRVSADLSGSGYLKIGTNATIGQGLQVLSNGMAVTGNADFANDIRVVGGTDLDGNVTLGNASSDAVAFSGSLTTNIIPDVASTVDLGSSTKPFQAVYADSFIGNIAFDTFTHTIAGEISASTDFALANFSSNLQLDLPAGSDGKVVRIKRIGTGNVTLSASVAGEEIFDETNGDLIVLETLGAAVTCIFSGSAGSGKWYII